MGRLACPEPTCTGSVAHSDSCLHHGRRLVHWSVQGPCNSQVKEKGKWEGENAGLWVAECSIYLKRWKQVSFLTGLYPYRTRSKTVRLSRLRQHSRTLGSHCRKRTGFLRWRASASLSNLAVPWLAAVRLGWDHQSHWNHSVQSAAAWNWASGPTAPPGPSVPPAAVAQWKAGSPRSLKGSTCLGPPAFSTACGCPSWLTHSRHLLPPQSLQTLLSWSTLGVGNVFCRPVTGVFLGLRPAVHSAPVHLPVTMFQCFLSLWLVMTIFAASCKEIGLILKSPL